MTTTRLLTLVSLLALGAAPARAESRVDEHRPARPDGVVRIDNAAGTLTITGWEKAEVAVAGRLGPGVERLNIDSRDERTTIELELRHGPHGDAELEVHVPAGSAVEVEGFAAEIRVAGVAGAVRVETVNGGIQVAAAGGGLELQTVNGPIEVTGSSSRAEVEAVNGEVTLRGVSGQVEAAAVNGRLRVEGGSFTRASFQTVSAPLSVECELDKNARLELDSVSGDVELALPADVSASFSVTTFTGQIDNQLGQAAPKAGHFPPHKTLSFTTGSGSASVNVQTLSGGITLRKR